MQGFDAEKTRDGIVRWIRGFFQEAGGGLNAVVGLSGGKDSSVVAALCAEALGPQRVFGLLLPQGEQWDIAVSRDLAARLGIRAFEINIADSVGALFQALRSGGIAANRPAEINTPARLRMTALYAAAASLGALVANTCNLSEDWVGYSTKFGDSAGDFSPLARLTAGEVKAVGRALGLPDKFVEKTPEDGLSGLSDEENLGFSYAVLDRLIREGKCDDERVREKIEALRLLGLHKLAPMPCYEPDLYDPD
ncbi:MAG: NAD(+) synthase [Treponema sp.]|nr:NAD(+) synthase [Treponema sp.]